MENLITILFLVSAGGVIATIFIWGYKVFKATDGEIRADVMGKPKMTDNDLSMLETKTTKK